MQWGRFKLLLLTPQRFLNDVCRAYLSIACLAVVWSSSAAAHPPEAENGHYQERVSIVGFPASTTLVSSLTTVTETKAVLQNLRMTGVSYAGLNPQQADDLAKTLRDRGSVTITLPTIERYSIVYFAQSGDVLSLCKRTVSKTIPPAKRLTTEETLPLIGKYEPGSVTVFAGSEHLNGGSEPGIYLGWTVKVVPLKAGQLRVGTNTLEIENTGNGPVSAVPWFGISFVRLRSQSDAVK